MSRGKGRRLVKSSRVGWIVCALVALCVAAPAAARVWDEQDFWHNPPRFHTFTPPGKIPREQVSTVIGQTRILQPEKGDTFLDVARYYDIGFNEIADANPGSDEWIPAQVGKPLVVPQEFILPDGGHSGIVINIPEMRLYYYPPPKKDAPPTVVTFPVGLGREDWKTPIGKFSIREKNVNPTWVIPESIRKERVADKGFSEAMIPGGSPDNPLGKYRMRLTLNLYGIHGTNIPWGVGMLVSHGCVRLYPEDIDRFFPMVGVGTRGEFVYQTVKFGLRSGRVYVEVHKDLYGKQPGPWRHAVALMQRQGLSDLVDQHKLLRAVEAQSGVPTDVTRGGAPLRRERGEPLAPTQPPRPLRALPPAIESSAQGSGHGASTPPTAQGHISRPAQRVDPTEEPTSD